MPRKFPGTSSDEAGAVTSDRPVVPTQPSSTESSERPVYVFSARYVLLPLANALTGYSVKAMERKIERGDWIEGKVWKRAPDGHVMIDMVGYQKWVESQ